MGPKKAGKKSSKKKSAEAEEVIESGNLQHITYYVLLLSSSAHGFGNL
jgi:hypothetical protein